MVKMSREDSLLIYEPSQDQSRGVNALSPQSQIHEAMNLGLRLRVAVYVIRVDIFLGQAFPIKPIIFNYFVPSFFIVN